MDKITLSQFWEMVDKHDWYHEMSDDRGVDARGAANWRKLKAISGQSSEHAEILEAFTKHHYSGKPWNTEQKPKPKKPLAENENEI